MHTQFILPALALLAPLVTAQQEDTPIVSAFIEYMEAEGFSSLNAGGFTREASQYSILIDSIEGVLAVSRPHSTHLPERVQLTLYRPPHPLTRALSNPMFPKPSSPILP